jgi:protein subunit release factor B
MFPVSTAKQQALEERFARLGIKEDDLEESFVRSGGKGGQNVNKVSTGVVLLHRPSGTLVKCQRTFAGAELIPRAALLAEDRARHPRRER